MCLLSNWLEYSPAPTPLKRMKILPLLLVTYTMIAVACTAQDGRTGPMKVVDETPEEPTQRVVKTDAEWKKILTEEQYRIARKAGTEAANNATYDQYKAQGAGTYYCAGCNAKLFHSKTKINANCGWPAFYDAAQHENIVTKDDFSHGRKRVEVLCAKCDAHLGHVFKGEGYDTPTDQRYCINGIILKFVPDKTDNAAPTSKDQQQKEVKK